MKYIKASSLLPDELLQAVQEYAEGCVIYIPNRPGLRKDWGKSTDTKILLRSRNRKIRDDHESGLSAKKLVDKYHLSESTIKKIIYCK
ncbi:MAG: CD3324 family protein [Oscillospiraceae bacterium]|nr:CD3324 family protein [Oscillospiraceae bacterium]